MPALAAVLALLLLVGCETSAGSSMPSSAAGAPTGAVEDGSPENQLGAGLTAVATVYPLAWIVAEVAPGADLSFLAAAGQDPHDLELGPADRAGVESADVLVYLGDIGFQPQIEEAVAGTRGEVVDVAATAGTQRLIEVAADDHGHDHGHEDGDDADVDPHAWLDPAIVADVAEAVGEAFAVVDPANAGAYRSGADAVAAELAALDDELDELLAGCEREVAIVSHEAYAYLLEPRGLSQEGISGTAGHGEASPQRLASLAARIRAEGIPVVLAEPVEGRADAEALAAEAGVDLVEVDPLEVVDPQEQGPGYPELLREQAATFAEALACP